MARKHALHHLPLRKLGLEHVAAVPVDIPGRATPPYVPFVPIEGTEADLFFDDEESNEALIELRRFVIDFVEQHERTPPRSGSGSGISSSEKGAIP